MKAIIPLVLILLLAAAQSWGDSYQNLDDLIEDAEAGDCIGWGDDGFMIIKDCSPQPPPESEYYKVYSDFWVFHENAGDEIVVQDDAIWIDWDSGTEEMKEFREKRKPGQHIAFDKNGKMIWAYDSVD